jgi:hypothetical protein
MKNEKEVIARISKIDKVKLFVQKELNLYKKDAEQLFDKYGKLSLEYLYIITACMCSSVVILSTSLNFTIKSQIIGFFVLVFAISSMFLLRYYLKNKNNEKLKLYIYESWQKSIFASIVINFGLYVFSSSPHVDMLFVLGLATVLTIVVQKKIEKSLLILF